MEESLLDFAAFSTSELLEVLQNTPVDSQNDIITEHIKKLCTESVSSVLDPNEKCEWVFGLKDESLASYCKGHVSLLDFFTYCCINCQHILPDLRDLEELYSIEDGFVVVGVHSAKFEAERLPSNVLHAVHRLNLKHPVMNDPEAQLWNRLGIHCWPTLVLLNPDGKPIVVLAGEGHREVLFRVVSVALNYYKNMGMLEFQPKKDFSYSSQDTAKSPLLRFPGKVILNPFSKYIPDNTWLTISDSGNNRIILVDFLYDILHIIGGPDANLRDGNFQEARFNDPQGICWTDPNSFVVCDKGNHVLRRVYLDTQKVEILAGTGVQGQFGDAGGLKYCQQSLASPWDIVLYKTADMDMSIRKPLFPPGDSDDLMGENEVESLRRVLLVACAGSHQIWGVFLDTTVWWKYKTYAEGTVLPIVGSGREENRNNRYPNSASLAQPSGLVLNGDTLYIADSESSSIRHLDLKTGQLSPLVGADRNPMNLFSFGDVDGKGYNVKLQHPLGVSFCQQTSKIIIADTYNHKIKMVDQYNNECITFYPTTDASIKLSEPGGICISPKTENLIVADTNNHRIVLIDCNTKESQILNIHLPNVTKKIAEKNEEYSEKNLITCSDILKILYGDSGKIILNINCDVIAGENNLHLTPDAPQRWCVKIFDPSLRDDITSEWEINGGIRNGKTIPGRFEAVKKFSTSGQDMKRIVRIEYFLSLCEGNLCSIRRFAVDFKLIMASTANPVQEYNVDAILKSEGNCEIILREV